MRAVKLLCIMSVLCVLSVVTACGNADSGGEAAGSGGDAASAGLPEVAASEFVDMTGKGEITITVRDNTFSPQYVTVSPGTKIDFDNRGRNPHNAIPVDKGSFDKVPTEDLQPGDLATVVIGDAGLYAYYCSLHGTPDAGMTGRIDVVG